MKVLFIAYDVTGALTFQTWQDAFIELERFSAATVVRIQPPGQFGEDCTVIVEARVRSFVNAYEVERCYGGPEEGGWWYDAGTPLASIPVDSDAEATAAREQLTRKFAGEYCTRYSRSHTNGGPDLEIYDEEHVAKAFPETRPHYE